LGDIVFAGGNGLAGQGSPTNTGGGGGSSAGSGNAGTNAISYLGATPPTGGGAGGNGKDSTGNGNGSAGSQPGGGGGGARGSSTGSQTLGGTGGAGQVIITIKALATATNPTPSGPTFASLFPGLNPTNVGADGIAYFMKYALGGTNGSDKVNLPTVAQNGASLTMTAIVRTNDTNLTIVGQTVTDLSGIWANLSSNPNGTASTNTNNVPAGCQRREFTVNSGTNNRQFLRLKATQNP
jgi:hypothetical protein